MRATRDCLGRVGVWSRELRFSSDRGAARDAVAELEALGYGAVFIPDVGGDVLGAAAELLAASTRLVVATGILNIWMHDPVAVAADVAALEGSERFLTGLGASHAAVVDASGVARYAKPLSTMRAYLEALDHARPPLAAGERILAALGPRMLGLARDHAGGAHPYLVPPEHTARARELLGPEHLLAPEQAVYLTSDLTAGRQAARDHVSAYLHLPNYVANLRRLGYEDADFADGGSDRLVNALVVYGDEGRIATRIADHLDAGADHVCVQVVGQIGESLAREDWRRLAAALTQL